MFTSVARIGATMFRVNNDPILAVRQAVACLKNGNVIAVPTDTVYGLAASAQDLNAVKLLYEIKAREPDKPVAVCVPRVRQYLFAKGVIIFVFRFLILRVWEKRVICRIEYWKRCFLDL